MISYIINLKMAPINLFTKFAEHLKTTDSAIIFRDVFRTKLPVTGLFIYENGSQILAVNLI